MTAENFTYSRSLNDSLVVVLQLVLLFPVQALSVLVIKLSIIVLIPINVRDEQIVGRDKGPFGSRSGAVGHGGVSRF